ncbi:hypothetical protein HMPREF0971_01923 [Segatella oris F0302]|uniref:Uncharacterized protein n=1 Tax=Segatella oris F0302 TaxID=649760 RepID=D1QSG4_9BACT|nr:hypothetical protein HMPREF0971_01923 [Segatella oris F0302]
MDKRKIKTGTQFSAFLSSFINMRRVKIHKGNQRRAFYSLTIFTTVPSFPHINGMTSKLCISQNMVPNYNITEVISVFFLRLFSRF